MSARPRSSKHVHRSLLSFGATALLAVAATAQVARTDDASLYRRDVQACQSGQTGQDRATCLREARNAQAERQRGRLASAGSFEQNALARCEPFKDATDREACRARAMGQGQASGSVEGGGILREYVVTLPPSESASSMGAPAARPSAPAAPADTTTAPLNAQPLPPIAPSVPVTPDAPAAPRLEPGPASGLPSPQPQQ